MTEQRIIVGISGASGFLYGVRALELLRPLDVEVHLVLSPGAERTAALEAGLDVADVRALADVVHPATDLGASIASGSFPALAMLVAPCSMRSLAAIAHGLSDNLLTRAADVTLKERRPLVLMVRETPLHLGHLRTMTALAEMGAVIAPPLPAFYAKPDSLEQMIDQSVGRALDVFGLDWSAVRRWEGLKGGAEA